MLRNNPFYILDIPVNAGKQEILSAAERYGLTADSDAGERAAETLINPVKRLRAELDWFPEEDEQAVRAIRNAVRSGQPVPDEITSKLSGAGKLNVLLHELSLKEPESYGKELRGLSEAIASIARQLDSFATGELLTAINEARREAGVAEAEAGLFFAECAHKKEQTATEIYSYAEKLTNDQQAVLMNALADQYVAAVRALQGADYEIFALPLDETSTSGAALFCELADRFETATGAENEEITGVLNKTIEDLTKKGSSLDTGARLKTYYTLMQDWLRYNRPLQYAAALKGATHEAGKEILINSLGMLDVISRKDSPLRAYELLKYLEEHFHMMPSGMQLIEKYKETANDLIMRLMHKSPEEALRHEKRDKRRNRIALILIICMFGYVGIRALTAPSEQELANDPSSNYYYEIHLQYRQAPHGEFESLKMPPTGFVFQDTMGEGDRSVTVNINGLAARDSFVRISDRNYGNNTYIFLPGEEKPMGYDLPEEVALEQLQKFLDERNGESSEDTDGEPSENTDGAAPEDASDAAETGETAALDETADAADAAETENEDNGVPPDAKILSVMVRSGESTEVKLPPGKYYISYDKGTMWYGWRFRFTMQYKEHYGAPMHYNFPEMTPFANGVTTLEAGKTYKLDLQKY